MNNDFSYCLGTKCDKKKECKRYIGNYILEFLPRVWIKDKDCILSNHKEFIKKDK